MDNFEEMSGGHSHANDTQGGHAAHHLHDHSQGDMTRAFAIGTALNLGFVVCEAFFGIRAGSLALLADAGHNLSDVFGLLLAWGAAYLSTFRPTVRRTYGLRSTSILAALFNALLLFAAIGGIAWEAIRRLQQPTPVAGRILLGVAAAGVVVNSVTALFFFSGRKGDLNVRGAYLHMAADAAVSFGVVVAGFLVIWTGWAWLDPVVSLVIVLVILVGTWGLLRESLNLALHAVPSGIDAAVVREYLSNLPLVGDVHDLHIWAMSTTETALTAHLVMPAGRPDDGFLLRASRDLKTQFGIHHVTLQIEAGTAACPQAPGHCV